MTLPQTYTLAEVAESLKCSRRFIADQIRAGVVHPMRLGGATNAPPRFTEADIEALMAAFTPAPTPGARRRRRRAA